MKVNFSKLTFKPTLSGNAVTQDLHREIAEAVYQNANTLAAHSFALRLYESDGEIEVSDEDVKHIEAILPGFKYFAQEAILKELQKDKDK